MNFGSHMSIAGGVHKSLERGKLIGITSMQIFTKNSNQWEAKPYTDKEITSFHELLKKYNIAPIVAHASYLINLASPDDKLFDKSIDSFLHELKRCDQLEIPHVVVHPGSHKGSGEKQGIERISHALNLLHQHEKSLKVDILLETTSGQGTNLGFTFEQIAEMMEKVVQNKRIGVCLDTCHIFSAGYDLRTPNAYKETLNHFDKVIGLNKIKVIHLNDSKKGLGSRVDRHEHIGKGEIGLEGFKNIVNDFRFSDIPLILETPKDEDMKWDKMNLRTLKKLGGK